MARWLDFFTVEKEKEEAEQHQTTGDTIKIDTHVVCFEGAQR